MKTIPPEYDGPIINGRLPATIELVQSWCIEAKAPIFSDDDAAAIARDVNYALCFEEHWRDEYKAQRDKNLSTQRMQRISDALAILQIDLPKSMEDTRRGKPDADLSATESLLELVGRHQAIIDAFPRRKKGRIRSLEKNLTANLANKALTLWGTTAPKSAGNAFSAMALTWLTGRRVPISDEAARKARERRTKKG